MHRSLIGGLLAASAGFLVAFLVGLSASADTASGIMQEIGSLVEPVISAGPIAILALILLNNAVKALAATLFGIILGLPPLLFVGINGFVMGAVISGVGAEKGLKFVLASLAPHGVIELPLLLLSAALGIGVGWESIRWLARKESSVRRRLGQNLLICVKWVLPGLAIAALIEIFVTPWIVRLMA